MMGSVVSLSLQIRRFRCPHSGCPRRIFAERLPGAAPFRKRRTVRLADVQRSLALGTGGELGSRLAGRLAMPVSGDTLLRLIRAVPVESYQRAENPTHSGDSLGWAIHDSLLIGESAGGKT
jgi:hypothetical protein